MSLSIEFIVHSIHVVPVTVTVQHEGADVRAAVDCCEVELTSANGVHGSFVARFTGADAAKANERFKPGQAVIWAL